MVSANYSIALIPGDGIGKEVVAATVEVLKALQKHLATFTLTFETYDWGTVRYKATGLYMPENGIEFIKKHDAALFGAVGAPDVPDHISLWQLLLPIRQKMQLFANVRPVKVFAGVKSPLANVGPNDLDWLLVRENT